MIRNLGLLSIMFIAAAVWLWFAIGDPQRAGFIGDYAAAVFAALAFAWLIAGLLLQSGELQLQRKQLDLQREELAAQREEMHRMAEQATLGQVATMLTNFNTQLPFLNVSGGGMRINAVEDIPTVLVASLPSIRETLRGRNAQDRYSAYMSWARVEGVGILFMGVVATAARLFAANAVGLTLWGLDRKRDVAGEVDAEFIIANEEILRQTPHIQLYMLSAIAVAQFFSNSRPGLLRTRLAGFEAAEEVVPGVFTAAGIDEIRRRVAALRPEEGSV